MIDPIDTVPPLMDYIDGQFIPPTNTLPQWNHDPNSGEPIQQQHTTSPEKLERALQVADRIHRDGRWRDLPPSERANLLEQAADWLAARVDEIGMLEAHTTGIIINTSKMVNQITHLTYRAAAGQLRDGWTDTTLPGPHGDIEILRRPWGPAACIAPWNAPAALAAHKVANALAAGCPVILKPSEWAPYSAVYLAQAAEAVGIPSGVFQIVNGGAEVGAALVSDPRIRCVSFTGGLHGGRAVAQTCAVDFKPLQLELGGNNAMIVLDDADLDATAVGIVAGMTTLNGQWCRALGRLLVQENIYNDLMERAFDALAAVKIGHSLDATSQMGPLVHKRHKDHVATAVAHLRAKGGTIHQVTPMPDLPGTYFPPTLITGIDPEETLEEIFGPVTAIHTFTTDTEAAAFANQAPYGLGGYVFGSEERALAVARQMETGGVKINGVSLIGLHPMAPRPAWKLSGIGEEGTAETFQFFCGTRVVGIAGT
ncbi:MAG: aldehyde dehydrogenase [Anaerolineales bacterium]|nr:aldehyde dehydrogenase [Anaerolineales bacterium]